MKKNILSLLAFAALIVNSENAFAQPKWDYNASNDLITSPEVRNVGIRLVNPNTVQYELTVHGAIGYEQSNTNRQFFGNTDHVLGIFSNSGWGDGSGAVFTSLDGTPDEGKVTLVSNKGNNTHYQPIDGGAAGAAFDFVQNLPGSNPWNSLMIIDKMGNAGIGTKILPERVNIKGNLGFENSSTTDYTNIRGGSGDVGLAIYAGHNFGNGSAIILNGNNNTSNNDEGSIRIVTTVPSGSSSSDPAINFLTFDGVSTFTTNLMLRRDGKLVVGNVSASSDNYKLFVEKGILTEKIKVALSTDNVNWSDFVFADDYALKSLNEVENFVKKNKHLPEIPSAKEVYKEGLDLAQMDAKLLQKIEELTLYIIQQQKEIDQLKKIVNQ